MRLRPIYFLLVLVLFSCGKKKDTPPAGLIDKNKFSDVLVDARLLEGAYGNRFVQVDSSHFQIDAYYLTLFQKHGVQKDQFITSYRYYSSHPLEMLSIEEDVMNKISALQASQEQINAQAKLLHQPDSLSIDSLVVDSVH